MRMHAIKQCGVLNVMAYGGMAGFTGEKSLGYGNAIILTIVICFVIKLNAVAMQQVAYAQHV
jgi:hypothetical protein